VTGNYPGRARTGDELRSDLDQAMRLIPGRHRVKLHARYAETGGRRIERNALQPEHFARWMDWAAARGIGLDFNGTFFSHPRAASGFTLSSADESVRGFWIEHGQVCRRIGAAMGRRLGTPCVTNLWIPDGMKDLPADRKGFRETLCRSLDEVFREPLDPAHMRDSVEGKLFGIGSESYVVGSHEFYLGYAVSRRVLLCLDTGHFHPTESVADKLSAVMPFVTGLLLHISRGVRWDSDHVVIAGDELQALMQEIVRGDYLDRVRLGLDFFDGSINRVAAWVIGSRATLRALLAALLEPADRLRAAERAGDYTARLALLEESRGLPVAAVWDAHCARSNVPVGREWLGVVQAYERDVQRRR
jgi:L-rhamnose isomerase